jgi:hypothetical protein
VLLGGGSGEPEQRQERQAPAGKSGGAPKKTGFYDMDDDIPFVSCCASFDMAGPIAKRMRRYRG